MTRTDRRGFLAAVGAVATVGIGGCSSSEDDESPPRIHGENLGSILTESAPKALRPAPVRPTEAAVDDGLDRTDELLARVPEPIDSDRVPNGVVREEIESIRASAAERRGAVTDAPDRFRALRTTRDARRRAREAATALDAVGDDAVASDVADERDEVDSTVRRRLSRFEYVGDDLRRTLLLAFRAESDLESSLRRRPWPVLDADPSVLDVGGVAGDVEFSAATVSVWDHLSERHVDRASGPTDFESDFEDALDRSLSAARTADVPDADVEALVDGEIERNDVRFLLSDASRAVTWREESIAEALSDGRLGRGLYWTLSFERDRRAFETVRDRIESDGLPEPAEADRVREEREAALSAYESVPVEPTEDSLAGDALAQAASWIQYVDAEVRRNVGHDADVSLSREYARYAHLRAQLEVLPDAIETVRDRLDGE